MIFHMTTPDVWAQARERGVYSASTRGATIADEGFMHASSDGRQCEMVAGFVYADEPDAFVCSLDEAKLADAGFEIRFEPGDPSDPESEKFPHVYGGDIPVELFHPVADSSAEPRILREDNPEAEELLDAGWAISFRSWGARLFLDDESDLDYLREFVSQAKDRGYEIREASMWTVEAIREFDDSVASDYPVTPATPHDPLPADLGTQIGNGSVRAFVATSNGGDFAGVTIMKDTGDLWEVDRTAVGPHHRSQGLAKALKSAAILALYECQARAFGTGGAGVNAASLAMNKAVGFELEPLWLTLYPPVSAHSASVLEADSETRESSG